MLGYLLIFNCDPLHRRNNYCFRSQRRKNAETFQVLRKGMKKYYEVNYFKE